MKNISEYLNELGNKSILESINSDDNELIVTEGLKDLWKAIKDKFSKVAEWFSGLVARISSKFPVWLAVDDEGNTMPASTPLTASQAYVDGYINKDVFCVIGDKQTQKITGNKADVKDVLKMYGDTNPVNYWKSCARYVKESKDFWDNFEEYTKNLDTTNTNDDIKSVLEDEEFVKEMTEKYDFVTEEMINEIKMRADDRSGEVVDNKMLMFWIDLALKPNMKKSLLIWGAPGIGKTAIVDQVMQDYKKKYGGEWNMIVRQLGTETSDSFSLPAYKDTEAGSRLATDLPKDWLPLYEPSTDPDEDQRRSDKLGHGILFIDELSRCSVEVQRVIFPLIQEHRLNGWNLGKGWKIICATNRMDDDPEHQTNLTKILLNRFVQVWYEPTYNDWRAWAEKQAYISPILLRWLEMKTDANGGGGGSQYWYFDPDEKSGDDTALMCTPRSWADACEVLCTVQDTLDMSGMKLLDVPTSVLKTVLSASVGTKVAGCFCSFIKVVKSIGGSLDDTINDIWKNGGKKALGATDNIKSIALMFSQLVVMSHAEKLPTEKEWNNLCDFLVALNSDQMATYILDMFVATYGECLADGVKKDMILKVKNNYDRILNQINNEAPAELKKLKTPAERRKWIDKQEDAMLSKVGGNATKLSAADKKTVQNLREIAANMQLLDNFEVQFKPFLAQWNLKGIEDIPDYAPGLVALGKKYRDLKVDIDMGNGETMSQFG